MTYKTFCSWRTTIYLLFGTRRVAVWERQPLAGSFEELKSRRDGGSPRTKRQQAAGLQIEFQKAILLIQIIGFSRNI